jgi:[DsrC]-trisulfide reductase subunit O
MSTNRRDFLKLAGLTATAGIAGGAISKVRAQDKLPQESPLVGKRWAMVVDVKKCLAEKDCNDCVTACHQTHNVPDFDNPKDEVKWIWKESFEHALHESAHEGLSEEIRHSRIPVLCNHCDNPPCTKVCPTQATWKREKDGIVMMDWHRCIGCRYCVAACPYGSRSFNWRDPRPAIDEIDPDFPTRQRGVVEKCTLCEGRLAQGLGPACVEACKAKALVFGDLEDPDSEVRELLKEKFSIRRKPGLGTQPQVYYVV